MKKFTTCIEYTNPAGNSFPAGKRRALRRLHEDDARALRTAERELDSWVRRSRIPLTKPAEGWGLKIIPIPQKKGGAK